MISGGFHPRPDVIGAIHAEEKFNMRKDVKKI